MSARKEILWIFFLSILMVVITLPRFNRQDWLIGRFTSQGKDSSIDLADAAEYIKIVEYFRDEARQQDLVSPFAYRPLAPMIASFLPWNPMSSINIVNLVSLLLCIPLLREVFKHLGISPDYRIIGITMFVVSFPVFYYATVGMVDPLLLLMFTLGVYFIIRDSWPMLLMVIIIGTFAKETIVILVPVYLTYLYGKNAGSWRIIKTILIFVPVFILAYGMARNLLVIEDYAWKPSSGRFIRNITRPQTWFSFILSFGIPGSLALWSLRYTFKEPQFNRLKRYLWLWTGFLLSLMLFGYAILSAYSDGRFIWISYPFSIPLALIALQQLKEGYNRTNAKSEPCPVVIRSNQSRRK